MSYQTLTWEQTGAVGRITFNRPERLNAWSRAMAREVHTVFAAEAAEESVRAVLVTGAGRAFCAGADFKADPDIGEDGLPDLHGPMLADFNPAASAPRRLGKPVVAAVHGAVSGIGCSFALGCDLVVAAESASFSQAFVHRGVMPDGGATLLLPLAVGKARAFELAMLGDKLDAARALDWGIVNRVVPDAELTGEADKLAEQLAGGPTKAYVAMKQAFNQAIYRGLDDQLALEADLQHALARTNDFAEGIRSFRQKRPPTFTGA